MPLLRMPLSCTCPHVHEQDVIEKRERSQRAVYLHKNNFRRRENITLVDKKKDRGEDSTSSLNLPNEIEKNEKIPSMLYLLCSDNLKNGWISKIKHSYKCNYNNNKLSKTEKRICYKSINSHCRKKNWTNGVYNQKSQFSILNSASLKKNKVRVNSSMNNNNDILTTSHNLYDKRNSSISYTYEECINKYNCKSFLRNENTFYFKKNNSPQKKGIAYTKFSTERCFKGRDIMMAKQREKTYSIKIRTVGRSNDQTSIQYLSHGKRVNRSQIPTAAVITRTHNAHRSRGKVSHGRSAYSKGSDNNGVPCGTLCGAPCNVRYGMHCYVNTPLVHNRFRDGPSVLFEKGALGSMAREGFIGHKNNAKGNKYLVNNFYSCKNEIKRNYNNVLKSKWSNIPYHIKNNNITPPFINLKYSSYNCLCCHPTPLYFDFSSRCGNVNRKINCTISRREKGKIMTDLRREEKKDASSMGKKTNICSPFLFRRSPFFCEKRKKRHAHPHTHAQEFSNKSNHIDSKKSGSDICRDSGKTECSHGSINLNTRHYIQMLLKGEKEAQGIIDKAYKNRDELRKIMNKMIEDEMEKFKEKEKLLYEKKCKKVETKLKNSEQAMQNELQTVLAQTESISLNIEDLSNYIVNRIVNVDLTLSCDLLKHCLPIRDILNVHSDEEKSKHAIKDIKKDTGIIDQSENSPIHHYNQRRDS
ncbi:conserved Plasmodium protein, unknown function [Plasmodium ovale wallikeri]|uniref:Uncharacterized protein n=1 Tax=Plasmodium ovale wallikeri TaxID=864142 RepID=A0A1A8Z372_PLAOA|nr:conserved Plasmodium protein, unknown function [Plasmodium ovale wallikeri]